MNTEDGSSSGSLIKRWVGGLLSRLRINEPENQEQLVQVLNEARGRHLMDAEALSMMEPQPVFSETKARGRWMQSVTWDHWKLIYNRKFDIPMLFNLAEDPGETLAVNEEHPEIFENLKAALDLWSDEIQQKSRGVEVSQPEFTPEQLEQLRSLGYVQ